MKYIEKEPFYMETHLLIHKILDADSLILKHEFTDEIKEVRLYGIDAPETRINKKMKADEQKAHVPAELLKELGKRSKEFLKQHIAVNDRVTIITENKNAYDYYHRQLVYVILKNGVCLNELLILHGFAKASRAYYCSNLTKYQHLHRIAQMNKKGLYSFIDTF